MKSQNLFQRIYILSLILIALSCSKDNPDSIPNAIPVMMNQQFEVSEDIGDRRTIATLVATDADGDQLTFNLESNIDLTINSTTGVVRTNDISILDFETATSISFDVRVSDNKGGTTTATITINVLDIDDGPLTNFQKGFIDEYIYNTYYLRPPLQSITLNRKWQGEIKIYIINGASSFPDIAEGYLEEFNALLTDGTSLVLVNTELESDVQLLLGSTDLQQVWPDLYNTVIGTGYLGIASYSTNSSNYIDNGRIWLLSVNENVFKHEVGHILGLGHTSDQYCQDIPGSVMCASIEINASFGFNAFDKEIIKALYHPDTSVGLTQEEIRVLITQYFVDGDISI